MLVNKKYEWMFTWTQPLDHQFACALFKNVYWAYQYARIAFTGTQDDKYRLAQLYDEAWRTRVGVEPKFGSLKYNAAFGYRYAVTKFISEVVHASYADDARRDREVANVHNEVERRRLEVDLNGFDPAEDKRQFELMEIALDADHAGDVERNERVLATPDALQYTLPPIDKSLQRPIITEFTRTVDVSRRAGGGRVHVHARIYDKLWGFYSVLVWSDNRPYVDGEQSGIRVCAHKLHVGRGTFGQGAVNVARRELENEAFRAKFADWTYRTGAVEATKTKKAKKPDISKIQKALGIEESAGDDLDGEIF